MACGIDLFIAYDAVNERHSVFHLNNTSKDIGNMVNNIAKGLLSEPGSWRATNLFI